MAEQAIYSLLAEVSVDGGPWEQFVHHWRNLRAVPTSAQALVEISSLVAGRDTDGDVLRVRVRNVRVTTP